MKINTKLIKDYIRENNLTKKEFCNICKISYSTMQKILLGSLSIPTSDLFKIARVLKVKVSELFE